MTRPIRESVAAMLAAAWMNPSRWRMHAPIVHVTDVEGDRKRVAKNANQNDWRRREAHDVKQVKVNVTVALRRLLVRLRCLQPEEIDDKDEIAKAIIVALESVEEK